MSNFTLEKTDSQSIWHGHPDVNYSWEGERLSWERTAKDENGQDVLVKTYKDPIKITGDFKAESKIYGIAGNIEKNTVEKFGGALKGFVWADNISGGGEVVLPFTAPHIFIAIGERLNPVLTEIGTSGDNYYEVVDGKTHIHVNGFSGVGGAAGAPPTLIAHYKMNENTASDNDEMVTNGAFGADSDWTKETGWSIAGGVASCDGSQTDVTNLWQDAGLVIGRRYKTTFTLSNRTAGTARIYVGGQTAGTARDADGTYSQFLVCTFDSKVYLQGNADFVGDIDNVSVKLCAAEDSSGNDHDGLLQEDTSAASVAGKVNTAFDFDGAADYIEIADHADFTPALTPFSISAGVYMQDATSFSIVSKGIYNIDGEWRFIVHSDDKVYFQTFDESVDACTVGRCYNTALTSYENQWIHLVGTYDGGITSSSFKIYLNAIRVDDTDTESNPASFVAVENLDHAVWIGRYDTSYANGLIDNVMFFNKELTADEVKRIYNNGHSTEILAEIDSVITPRRSNTSPLGLRARYEFP